MTNPKHDASAHRLPDAYSGGTSLPLRDQLEPTDDDGAYALQEINAPRELGYQSQQAGLTA